MATNIPIIAANSTLNLAVVWMVEVMISSLETMICLDGDDGFGWRNGGAWRLGAS